MSTTVLYAGHIMACIAMSRTLESAELEQKYSIYVGKETPNKSGYCLEKRLGRPRGLAKPYRNFCIANLGVSEIAIESAGGGVWTLDWASNYNF